MKQSSKRILPVAFSVILPASAVLAVSVGLGLRGSAAPTGVPVTPSSQALGLQSAFEQIAVRLRPSIVFIRCQRERPASRFSSDDSESGPFGRPYGMPPARPSEACGSGVIVRGDGYILTNDHVVAGASRVIVRLQDGRELEGQVRRDYRSDLALIKVEASDLPAAEFEDSDQVNVGQWAVAFGSPFGLSDTMTLGIISSTRRQETVGQGHDGRFYGNLLQTDASINPGNSGGPLVDINGRIMGINVAIESPSGASAGIGFAIPANTARYVVEQLIRSGKVTRGYLGLVPVKPGYTDQQRTGVSNGAIVGSVADDSPAARAGIQQGDLILRFGDQVVTDDAQLRDLAARCAPGTRIALTIRRGKNEQTVSVAVEALPDSAAPQENGGPAEPQGERRPYAPESPDDDFDTPTQPRLHRRDQ